MALNPKGMPLAQFDNYTRLSALNTLCVIVELWNRGTAGILIFSGSLYLLTLTDTGWLGAITPFGGAAFILGWIFFAVGVLKQQGI